jgi:hypothetical protein
MLIQLSFDIVKNIFIKGENILTKYMIEENFKKSGILEN